MEMPQSLEALHHHLRALEGVLQEEQDLLLHPRPDADLADRLRLEQEKQVQFQAIESLQGSDGVSVSEQADRPPLWQEVRDLTDQVARLYQLNSTLIRQGLVHNQVVLQNLRQWGTQTVATAGAGMAVSQPEPVAETKTSTRKPRTRRKAAEEPSRVH